MISKPFKSITSFSNLSKIPQKLGFSPILRRYFGVVQSQKISPKTNVIKQSFNSQKSNPIKAVNNGTKQPDIYQFFTDQKPHNQLTIGLYTKTDDQIAIDTQVLDNLYEREVTVKATPLKDMSAAVSEEYMRVLGVDITDEKSVFGCDVVVSTTIPSAEQAALIKSNAAIFIPLQNAIDAMAKEKGRDFDFDENLRILNKMVDEKINVFDLGIPLNVQQNLITDKNLIILDELIRLYEKPLWKHSYKNETIPAIKIKFSYENGYFKKSNFEQFIKQFGATITDDLSQADVFILEAPEKKYKTLPFPKEMKKGSIFLPITYDGKTDIFGSSDETCIEKNGVSVKQVLITDFLDFPTIISKAHSAIFYSVLFGVETKGDRLNIKGNSALWDLKFSPKNVNLK